MSSCQGAICRALAHADVHVHVSFLRADFFFRIAFISFCTSMADSTGREAPGSEERLLEQSLRRRNGYGHTQAHCTYRSGFCQHKVDLTYQIGYYQNRLTVDVVNVASSPVTTFANDMFLGIRNWIRLPPRPPHCNVDWQLFRNAPGPPQSKHFNIEIRGWRGSDPQHHKTQSMTHAKQLATFTTSTVA